MLKTSFTLIDKKSLTHDVYELTYELNPPERGGAGGVFKPKAGQYVMFQLAPGLNRAYSLASFGNDAFTLIIKRVPDGKGSPLICDAEIGTIFQGMIPLGHFVLQNTSKSKCFIGTGTGFAPLYCQLLGVRAGSSYPSRLAFIFGVRNFSDSFYESEIESFAYDFAHFEYIQYFSRELDMRERTSKHESRVGYVTDWITRENIAPYEEFYICGSPAMVKSARENLETLGIPKEQIFWEQF